MPHIKCLAQGLRVVVMVMLFPAASTTTLPTPSHHAPPSSPVPGPLLWSIGQTCFPLSKPWAQPQSVPASMHYPLQQPLTSLLLQVSAHSQRLLPVHPCYPTLQ